MLLMFLGGIVTACPLELMVEKKIGKAGVKVSPAVFRKACREYAAKQVDIQKEAFVRLGILGDWGNPYYKWILLLKPILFVTLGKITSERT